MGKSLLNDKFGIEHQVELTDSTPIFVPPYRTSPVKLEFMIACCNRLLKQGVIKRADPGPWNFPCLLVKKKDATGDNAYRLVVDFRKLNLVCKRDSYPIARVDDILMSLGG